MRVESLILEDDQVLVAARLEVWLTFVCVIKQRDLDDVSTFCSRVLAYYCLIFFPF